MKKNLLRFFYLFAIITSIVLINKSINLLAFNSVISSPIHQEITRTALSFLKEEILEIPIGGCDRIQASGCKAGIIDGNDFEFDAQESDNSRIHFDSCNFSGASSYIKAQYNIVIGEILEGDVRAPEHFGNLLHTVQDFYAHSNWIELGNVDTLFAPRIDEWPSLVPFSSYNGVVIVQNTTDAIMENHTLSRDGKVIWVDEVYPGLITGATNGFNGCPVSIRIGHWDASPDNPEAAFTLFADSPGRGEPGYGTGLNKDNDSRTGFSEAKILAIRQTTHEWCRLINLVSQQGGDTAVADLFKAWVDPDHFNDAIAACSGLGIDVISRVPELLNLDSNELRVGRYAEVFVTDDEGLSLQPQPGLHFKRLEFMPSGSIVEIIGGPQDADGYIWWQVRSATGKEGWAVEGADGLITLVPYSPPPVTPTVANLSVDELCSSLKLPDRCIFFNLGEAGVAVGGNDEGGGAAIGQGDPESTRAYEIYVIPPPQRLPQRYEIVDSNGEGRIVMDGELIEGVAQLTSYTHNVISEPIYSLDTGSITVYIALREVYTTKFEGWMLEITPSDDRGDFLNEFPKENVGRARIVTLWYTEPGMFGIEGIPLIPPQP